MEELQQQQQHQSVEEVNIGTRTTTETTTAEATTTTESTNQSTSRKKISSSYYYKTSQKLKEERSKLTQCYHEESLAHSEVDKCFQLLSKAKLLLEEKRRQSSKQFEICRLMELNEPSPWNEWYKQLVEYKNQNGHCRVPSSTPLGRWVSDQRTYKKNYDRNNNNNNNHKNSVDGSDAIHQQQNENTTAMQKKKKKKKGRNNCRMTPTRIESLSKLDFCWNMDEYKWEQNFKRLQEYSQKNFDNDNNNNTTTSSMVIKDIAIRKWLDGQRMQYRAYLGKQYSNITKERIEKIKSTGFKLSPDDDDEEEDENNEEEAGGTITTTRGTNNSSNINSTNNNEQRANNNSQTKKRCRSGLRKNPIIPTSEELDQLWQQRYEELVEFQKQHGDCMMYRYEYITDNDDIDHELGGGDGSSNQKKNKKKKQKKITIGNYQLIRFCALQRKEYKKYLRGEPSELTSERIEKLENIGFNLSMGIKAGTTTSNTANKAKISSQYSTTTTTNTKKRKLSTDRQQNLEHEDAFDDAGVSC